MRETSPNRHPEGAPNKERPPLDRRLTLGRWSIQLSIAAMPHERFLPPPWNEADMVDDQLTPDHGHVETVVRPDTVATEFELELLAKNVEDIRSLRSAAEQQSENSNDETRWRSLARRGAVGAALNGGRTDLLDRQLPSWSVYFARQIDYIMGLYPLIEAGEVRDPRIIQAAFGISTDILSALDRTISKRLAS